MISQRQMFLRHVAQTSDAPMMLEIERAEGMYLYGPDGQRWMDLIAGIGVSSVGHRHPSVQAAVERQVGLYWHTLVYGEMVMSPQVELSRWLAEHLPADLDNVYLVNSGTEATEGAMKLAKRFTGRGRILSCRNAYHGSTQGAASLMSESYFTQAFRPLLPGIGHITFNDFDDLAHITPDVAGVVVETVQAEAGIYKPADGYLQALRARCTEVGALLILDEVQAGCGRTGSLWAFEQYGIVPDVLTLAKGFGGGMPVGAFIAPKRIMQTLSHDPVLGHITTYGGHPVMAAAALATLKTITEGGLIDLVPQKEARFRGRLVHARIREVRSAGLWLAVELADFGEVQRVIKHCIANGVITDWFLFNDRSLRIAPPLIITESEIDHACDVILAALDAL